jgi:hypothetical protein
MPGAILEHHSIRSVIHMAVTIFEHHRILLKKELDALPYVYN